MPVKSPVGETYEPKYVTIPDVVIQSIAIADPG
jgi:hypothetical protein